MKIIRWFIAAVPLLWVSLFYLFVVRAMSALGRLPVYNQPDPKDLGFDVHHSVLFLSMQVCFVTIMLYPILAFFSRKMVPVSKGELFVCVLGLIFFLITVFADPYGLMGWFAD